MFVFVGRQGCARSHKPAITLELLAEPFKPRPSGVCKAIQRDVGPRGCLRGLRLCEGATGSFVKIARDGPHLVMAEFRERCLAK